MKNGNYCLHIAYTALLAYCHCSAMQYCVTVSELTSCRQLVIFTISYLKHKANKNDHCETGNDVGMILDDELMTEDRRILSAAVSSTNRHDFICKNRCRSTPRLRSASSRDAGYTYNIHVRSSTSKLASGVGRAAHSTKPGSPELLHVDLSRHTHTLSMCVRKVISVSESSWGLVKREKINQSITHQR